MSRRVLGLALLAMAGGALAAAVSQTPKLLRRLDTFRVRHVEVVGTRFMAPAAVLKASGIDSTSNVFDDAAVWRQRLLRRPLIAAVEVHRRLPGTIVLKVTETRPVALIRGHTLEAVDARGRVLAIDPALTPVDLPVLDLPADTTAGGRLRTPAASTVLETLDRIRRFEPAFARQVSEVALTRDGAIRLWLRHPDRAVALLPEALDALKLRELVATLADLDARQELSRLRLIDGRFRDQVVVSLTPQAS